MSTVKEGDEVRVFDVNGRRMGQPEGGWVGHVTKVGRSLVYIEYGRKPKSFRQDTCISNDNMGHQSFRTMDQVALAERMHNAKAVLREHRITLDFGCTLTLEQIEALAEVARSFSGEAQQS